MLLVALNKIVVNALLFYTYNMFVKLSLTFTIVLRYFSRDEFQRLTYVGTSAGRCYTVSCTGLLSVTDPTHVASRPLPITSLQLSLNFLVSSVTNDQKTVRK